MEVFKSPLVSSLEIWAIVHSSWQGKRGRDGIGNKSISLSKVPGETTRYLIWFPIRSRYSLLKESSSSTSMDRMTGLAARSSDISGVGSLAMRTSARLFSNQNRIRIFMLRDLVYRRHGFLLSIVLRRMTIINDKGTSMVKGSTFMDLNTYRRLLPTKLAQ